MTAYLIVYGATAADRLAAYSFATRAEAWKASTGPLVPGVGEHSHAGGCAYVIESEKDVPFSGKLLLDVFNGLNGQMVARFADRASGIKRLMASLPDVAQKVETQIEEKEKVSETETETPAKNGRGRKSSLSNDQVIKLLVDENPKRPGSPIHGKFEKLFANKNRHHTVAEALELGFTPNELNWHKKHDVISID